MIYKYKLFNHNNYFALLSRPVGMVLGCLPEFFDSTHGENHNIYVTQPVQMCTEANNM